METYRSGWIAKHTGLSRRTMENYAKRGYIHPQLEGGTNNYRGYSMRDIETAWKIKQLIVIGYTHAEIRSMLQSGGGLDVRDSIWEKIRLLEQEQHAVARAIAYARQIAETGEVPPLRLKTAEEGNIHTEDMGYGKDDLL